MGKNKMSYADKLFYKTQRLESGLEFLRKLMFSNKFNFHDRKKIRTIFKELDDLCEITSNLLWETEEFQNVFHKYLSRLEDEEEIECLSVEELFGEV